MNRRTAFASVLLFVTPAALQAASEKSAPPAASPSPVAKKRHRFFDPDELHKDRSLPAGDKVPMTDGKPHKRESVSEQLHKDRSNDK